MRLLLATIVLLTFSACVTIEDPPNVQAIRDLIAVGDLQEVEKLRVAHTPNYRALNDFFVATMVGDQPYLLELRTRCRALRRSAISPSMIDIRRDATYIRPNWDTIRGCEIKSIYEISEPQLIEILEYHGLKKGSVS